VIESKGEENEQGLLAAGTSMAVSAMTLLMIAEPASAAPHRPAVDYCLSGEEGTDCSFAQQGEVPGDGFRN